jgi:hypothetical protein
MPGPLASKQLREEAIRRFQDELPQSGWDAPHESRKTPDEEARAAPLDPRSQRGRDRSWQAAGRLLAPEEIDAELRALSDRYDLGQELEALVLRAAQQFDGAQHEGMELELGLIDVLRTVGLHDLALEVVRDHELPIDSSYPELAEVDLLEQLGVQGEDLEQVIDAAAGDMHGQPGAVTACAAFLMRESDQHELLDELANAFGVDPGDLEDTVDDAIDAGHLDPAQLADGDKFDGDGDGDLEDDEADDSSEWDEDDDQDNDDRWAPDGAFAHNDTDAGGYGDSAAGGE